MRLEEVLRQDRVLLDRLQDRVLLRDLLADAERRHAADRTGQAGELRTAAADVAREAAPLAAAEVVAQVAAEETLRLRLLLLSVPQLFESSHV
jgi:hypothetical protein